MALGIFLSICFRFKLNFPNYMWFQSASAGIRFRPRFHSWCRLHIIHALNIIGCNSTIIIEIPIAHSPYKLLIVFYLLICQFDGFQIHWRWKHSSKCQLLYTHAQIAKNAVVIRYIVQYSVMTATASTSAVAAMMSFTVSKWETCSIKSTDKNIYNTQFLEYEYIVYGYINGNEHSAGWATSTIHKMYSLHNLSSPPHHIYKRTEFRFGKTRNRQPGKQSIDSFFFTW